MTSNIFHEPTPNHVAHTPSSLMLANDPKIVGWVDLFTENIWPAATYTNEALEKWPGSMSPQETGFSIGVRSAMTEAPMAGKTSLYQEVLRDSAATVRFRDAMEYFSSGEGYEVSSLVENYDWASLGNGTIVDVSFIFVSQSCYTRKILLSTHGSLDITLRSSNSHNRSEAPMALHPTSYLNHSPN
jgi:hypothetical protein